LRQGGNDKTRKLVRDSRKIPEMLEPHRWKLVVRGTQREPCIAVSRALINLKVVVILLLDHNR